MPLCLTFIDSKKASDTVETEAVFSIATSRPESRHSTTTSPSTSEEGFDKAKLFTATLEDVMRRLEWDNMGVRVDGRLLHHLRFADYIVLITPSISQAERMLADFDDAFGDRSPTEFNEDDVHEKRMGPGCPILAQRNDHLRMLQLRLSRSGSQHDERPRSRAGQEEASGLGNLQDHRGRSEEDEEHQAPCPPLQHHVFEDSADCASRMHRGDCDVVNANLGAESVCDISIGTPGKKFKTGVKSAAGFYGNDTIRLGDHGADQLALSNIKFGQATQLGFYFVGTPYDGVFGLAFSALSKDNYVPPFEQAYNRRLVDPVFTLFMEKNGGGKYHVSVR
ncbi:hypothetical protein ANCCEY_06844 [Ancylostoma ceylanicum]|uniref:Peptidase A1 domain-containing protein n=1 Tax=Ancylostoma ceylanicum TaxID=53326 RepID=A0A0D6M2D2_9BILA|nr:hypothetical protein ANCCEY_06844 [Ancylostoma ceylanicum]